MVESGWKVYDVRMASVAKPSGTNEITDRELISQGLLTGLKE